MKEFFKSFSEAMDSYIKTENFKWFRKLILALGFTVTGCVCFLAGFFMNRHDNMIYQSNINALNRMYTAENQPEGQNLSEVPAVTEAPEESEMAPVTTVTTTEKPKETLSRELLDSYIYEDLEFTPYTYRYSNTAAFHNRATFDEFGIPLTKKAFTLSYEGLITAAFDADNCSSRSIFRSVYSYMGLPLS